MPPKPIGAVPMSVAERSRRHRAKAKALRDAATPPPLVEPGSVNGSIAAPVAEVISGHEYPRMLYRDDGRTVVVATPEEHHELMKAGWVTVPYPVHTRNPPTPFANLLPFAWPFGAYRGTR
jgi:hypothetical protein